MHTFPEIKVKSTNFSNTPELDELLTKRFATLEKFLPDDESDLICDVELEKLSEHHAGPIYRAEVNLKIGGTLLRAEATAEHMEDAIDQMKNELKRELGDVSGKRASLIKRGARKIKEMMRFG